MKAAALLLLASACSSVPPERPVFVASVRTDVGFCSGAVVSPDTIFTAAHCIRGPVVLAGAAGSAFRSSHVSFAGEDLALVHVPGLGALRAKSRWPEWGERAVVHTLAGDITTYVTSVDSWFRTADLAWTAYPGCSGSAVTGADGALLCVLRAYYAGPAGGSVCEVYHGAFD